MSDLEQDSNAGLSKAREAANGVADELVAEAGDIGKTAKSKVTRIGKAVSDKADHLSDQTGEPLRKGKAAIIKWEEALQNHIIERPLATVLVAAAVGVGIALLLGGRSRD